MCNGAALIGRDARLEQSTLWRVRLGNERGTLGRILAQQSGLTLSRHVHSVFGMLDAVRIDVQARIEIEPVRVVAVRGSVRLQNPVFAQQNKQAIPADVIAGLRQLLRHRRHVQNL